MKLPAREVEVLVNRRLVQLLSDPLTMAASASLDLVADRVADLHRSCAALAQAIQQPRSPALTQLVQQVQVGTAEVTITVDATAFATLPMTEWLPDAPATLALTCTARLTRSGRALRLFHESGAELHGTPDEALIRLLVHARGWLAVLRTGNVRYD